MMADVKERDLYVTDIFLTHTHRDHIAVLPKLVNGVGRPMVWVNEREPFSEGKAFAAGTTFQVDDLFIETRLTDGHSPGGTSYIISGLDEPVAIVGDSLFCCSQGGASSNYATALANNRLKLLSLRRNTIVCPGHGPMSTIGEEQDHNPFFPEFKNA